VRSVDVKEALRLQQENNFVILDVRPEAEFKEVHYRPDLIFLHFAPLFWRFPLYNCNNATAMIGNSCRSITELQAGILK
jgi:rhodanese-related sulfurtransferase